MNPAEETNELASGQTSRRIAPRYGVDEEAHLLLVQHGSTVPCRVVDFSLSGCRLRTRERFPVGAMVRVEVSFKVRGLAFRFSGMTLWTDGRNLAGIRFMDVPARRKEELDEALSEVAAEEAAKTAKQAGEKRAAEEKAAAAAFPKQAAAEEQQQSPAPAPAQSAGQPPKPSKRDRRIRSREEVNTTAVIHLINIASRLPGRILDLSLDGCRIRTDEHFPVGIYIRVEVEFSVDGLPFRLGGVIQAIHDRNNVGIRFLDMSSRRREQIEQLIEEMREERE